ncbi:SseB family protein [Microbacterium sp. RD1]|uniref:SseB family protein n=1 Tax=Microbacterium sp. RD1 TaxID=3457313 RepID=UPI003FA5FB9F
MGLFSRRKDSAPEPHPEVEETAVEPPEEDAAPEVQISVSAFRGVAAPSDPAPPATSPPSPEAARRQVPAEAPQAAGSAGGLRDNALLVQALAAISATPTAPELLDVVRQLLQGHLFMRVQGDARTLLAEGKPLSLSAAAVGDKRYVLAYSGGAALQASLRADGDAGTSALGQPVLGVLRHVLAGDFDGIILDNNSAPARAVLPRAVLERAIRDADEELRIKTLLTAPRTDATASEIVAVLPDAPLWIAVKRTEEDGPLGVAESRTADGQRFLEVYSHPLESVALGRGDSAAPITPVQLATALARDENLAGVLVNPAGPWIRLTRSDLAPLLALAD